jgi:hypothetical protein
VAGLVLGVVLPEVIGLEDALPEQDVAQGIEELPHPESNHHPAPHEAYRTFERLSGRVRIAAYRLQPDDPKVVFVVVVMAWARMDSNHRPADYESRKKPSDTVQRRRSEYKQSTRTSNNSAVVRHDPFHWQSRLAVNL